MTLATGPAFNLYYFRGIAFLITKKRDGFLVTRCVDGRSDFLSFTEGLLWRAFKGIPKRFIEWSPPDGSTQRATPPVEVRG